jgi:hypothetical protein
MKHSQLGLGFFPILWFVLSYGIPISVISAGLFGDVKPIQQEAKK